MKHRTLHFRLCGSGILLALAFLFLPALRAQNLAGWKLTFDDEFNGNALDTSKWNTCYQAQGPGTGLPCSLVGNNEMELYQPASQFTEANGVLSIRGDKLDTIDPVTGATYHYASGVLASFDKFSQTYGYFEMRAELPAGQGLWPAFWMDDNAHQWPPELDPLEMLGNQPDAPHLGAIESPRGAYLAKYVYTFDTSTAYHTYGIEWDANQLTYYYDGHEVAQTTTASNMHSPMQLLANLAIGGNWPGPPDATTVFPAYMKIDYIRGWSRDDSSAPIPHTAGYDIGSTGLPGSTQISLDHSATISGAGSGYLVRPSDSFHFAAKPISGDVDFTLQVSSVPSRYGPYTPQTGVMVRDGLADNARYTAVYLADHKCILQSRYFTGGIPARNAVVPDVPYPAWVRLIRRGDAFSAYLSTDGLSWKLVGNARNDIFSPTMTSSAYVGAAISSGSPGIYNTLTSTSFDHPAVEITQDDADPSGVTITGTWTASSNNGGYYGTDYLTDGNKNKGADSVQFTPNLPSDGMYDVYIRWVGFEKGRDTAVPVTVTAADGTHKVYVNEQHDGSEWMLLGTFPMNSGSTDSVLISNEGTTDTVSVDAVRFVPGLASAPAAPSLPAAPRNPTIIATPDTNQVTLAWEGTPLATSYTVLRGSSPAGPFAPIATLIPTSVPRYTDKAAPAGVPSYYAVAGVNASGVGSRSRPVAAIPSIIVDDTNSAAVKKVGTWVSSTSAYSLYYGSDYLHDGNTGTTGGKSVTFTPALPRPGNYYVFLRWTSGSNRATNVPVDVNSLNGKASLSIDESVSDGVWWYCLGSYPFANDGTGNVTIRNDGANAYVIADAVEFVPNLGSSMQCPAAPPVYAARTRVAPDWDSHRRTSDDSGTREGGEASDSREHHN